MKKLLALLVAAMLLTLCACGSTQTDDPGADTSSSVQAQDPGAGDTEVQYDYQLKAGEPVEVYDVTFEKMVTVTVDPASTRDAGNELRSAIYFDNCVFNGGLTIVGDYHAMVTLGGGCSFGEGSVVTCKEATSGAAKEATLEDNFIKVFISCEGVNVETESAIGMLSDGPDMVLNGTTYSKAELAPDVAFLGVYTTYEGDTLTYTKLAIGEDESVEFLE
ncbi:MAG: hypothetical protein ACOX7F_00890 [Eubacteriales bacterium]